MRGKRLSSVLCVLFIVSFCGAESAEEPVWTITAAKFSLIDVPELYASYAEELPAMFNFFCAGTAEHLVTPEEKKARKLLDLTAQKYTGIKERAALIAERDSLYLAVMTKAKKGKKTAVLEKKIAEKEQEIEKKRQAIERVLADTSFSAETVPVQFWHDGQKVFVQPEHTNLGQALKSENIDAVINGSIQDVAGYMYVSVVLTTGLAGMPEYTFQEAGHYRSVEAIARSLAAQVLAAIKNTKPARVRLTVEPKDAEIYLDNERLSVDKRTFYLYEGSRRIEVLAPHYNTAEKILEVKANTTYLLKIKLSKEKKISVGFRLSEPAADVFLHTQYFAGTPFKTEVPAGKTALVTFAYGDVKTYTVIRPYRFMQLGQTTYDLHTSLNKERTKTKIDRQRKVVYWSLGAFYISLPVFMILQGLTADMAAAIGDSRLVPTDEVRRKYRSLFISSAVIQGLTIGLGINYAVQLGLYFYAADQSIPKEPVSR